LVMLLEKRAVFLRGAFALFLGSRLAKGLPALVQNKGIGGEFLARTESHKPGFDHRPNPGGVRRQTELKKRFGMSTAHLQQRDIGFGKCPEQQPFNVGAIGIEGRFVACIGFQEAANRAIPLNSLYFGGKRHQIVSDGWQLLLERAEVELTKARIGRPCWVSSCLARPGLKRAEAFIDCMLKKAAADRKNLRNRALCRLVMLLEKRAVFLRGAF
nr:hypothetical protein [Tanacetum cinerariifolium]